MFAHAGSGAPVVSVPIAVCLFHATWQDSKSNMGERDEIMYTASLGVGIAGIVITLLGFYLNYKRSRRKYDVNQLTMMSCGLVVSIALLIYIHMA